MELIFTNHDLLTDIMPFANGGYYNYDHLLYKTSLTTGLHHLKVPEKINNVWYTLNGHYFTTRPVAKGIYIHQGKIITH